MLKNIQKLKFKIIKKTKNTYFIFYGPLGFIIILNKSIYTFVQTLKTYKLVFQNKNNITFFTNLLLQIKKNLFLGYRLYLEVKGIGYKITDPSENILKFELGYSHPIFLYKTKDILFSIHKNRVLKLFGISSQNINQLGAYIKQFKRPEPYKGKGVRYLKELIKTKQGKKKKR